MNRRLMEQELTRDEGLRLKVYFDSRGVPTVGVGRNLRDVGISPEEALLLLEHDIERTEKDLDEKLSWWRGLDEVRQRVVLNMAFNLGVEWRDRAGEPHGLVTFPTTLALVRTGQYAAAAEQMLRTAWAEQVGVRAERLAKQMRDGTPQEV